MWSHFLAQPSVVRVIGFLIPAGLLLWAFLKRKAMGAFTGALWSAVRKRFWAGVQHQLQSVAPSAPQPAPADQKTYRGHFQGFHRYEPPPRERYFTLTLDGTITKAPEPSREQKEAQLKSLNSVPSLLKRAFAKTAKKLPHAPGGHPFALQDLEQRFAICKLIEAYRTDNHMDTAEAVAKVASELKRRQRTVSTKTLRRYYDKFLREQDTAPALGRQTR